MKVYVVIEVFYSNTNLVACFAKREDAEDFINRQKAPHCYRAIEMDVK